jgi:hypothetical protein
MQRRFMMADKYNLVSGEISDEKVKEIQDTITRWRTEMPFLVAFSEEDRKHVVKPGDTGVSAAVVVADAAAEHPNFFPKDVADPAEIRRDAALADTLSSVAATLSAFAQAVDDTVLAAKSDAYRGGLKLYGVAKLLKTQIPGLSERISPLKERLDRVVRKSAAN